MTDEELMQVVAELLPRADKFTRRDPKVRELTSIMRANLDKLVEVERRVSAVGPTEYPHENDLGQIAGLKTAIRGLEIELADYVNELEDRAQATQISANNVNVSRQMLIVTKIITGIYAISLCLSFVQSYIAFRQLQTSSASTPVSPTITVPKQSEKPKFECPPVKPKTSPTVKKPELKEDED